MSGELLNLTKDLVFQELFGKQKNKDITAHLLSLILNRKIKISISRVIWKAEKQRYYSTSFVFNIKQKNKKYRFRCK